MPARPAGEESLTGAIAAQAIEAQPSFGQIKPSEAVRAACQTASGRDDMATIGSFKIPGIPSMETETLAD